MTWQLLTFAGLAAVLVGGFAWYERSRPPARLVALVAALAALAIAGRLVLAPIPNVVATTDIALITGYALGAAPGFAVGALAAPISNIWLGQGPWTAWEMAGWGLVGLAGAWLAVVTHRRLGRLGLASVCAAAGFAYGALLDLSVMVTYGGEQSLDRYLALSARGLPFNIAHAAGNFAIALAAGPALVRMISRYRTRLEFSWPRPAGALTAVLAALVLAASLAASVETANGTAGEGRTWLVRSQASDGGFAAARGNPSSPAMTGWAMLGLEAAGRNPLDVRNGGESPVSYLRAEVGRLQSAGDLERTILALEGAGLEPRDLAGTNLVSELRARRDGDGSLDGQVNLTAFYVLAMRAAGAGGLGRPAGWLRRARNDDGGWGFRPGAPSDPDSTGATLQALAAAGSGGRTTKAAVRYLRRSQRDGGGWALATSGAINAQSTAWAVQGLVAAGGSRKAVRKGIDYLARLQASDGHYRYSAASDQTPIWVTAQVLLAVERQPFPVPAVARRQGGGGGSGDGSGSRSAADTSDSTPAPASTPSPSAPTTPGLTGSVTGGGGARGSSRGGNSGRDGGADPGRGSEGAAIPGGVVESEGGGEPAAEGAGGVDAAADSPAGSEAAEEAYAPAGDVESEPLAPYVAAGLGALALALAAGFFWYRRRLP